MAMQLLAAHSEDDGTLHGPQLRSPLSKAWSALPVVTGATMVVVACLHDTLSEVFPFHSCQTIPMRCMFALFGIVLMSAAVPTFQISVIAESQAFAEMLESVRVEDEAFAKQLLKDMDGLWCASLLYGLIGTIVHMAVGWAVFRTMSAAVLVGLLGCTATMANRVQGDFLSCLVALCHKDLDALIASITRRDSEKGSDWAEVAAAHHALDLRLENVWSVGSMLLGPLVARNCALAAILLACGAVMKTPLVKVVVWSGGAILMGRAIWTLREPADITTRCVSTSARDNGRAIRAAVSTMTCHTRMSESEEVAHLRFLQYLNNTTIGVELFGVVVTPALVIRIFVGMGTNIPIAIGILESLMKENS